MLPNPARASLWWQAVAAASLVSPRLTVGQKVPLLEDDLRSWSEVARTPGEEWNGHLGGCVTSWQKAEEGEVLPFAE